MEERCRISMFMFEFYIIVRLLLLLVYLLSLLNISCSRKILRSRSSKCLHMVAAVNLQECC